MMYTFTGLTVAPLTLTLDQVRVEDLAHHLALENRFAGATRRPISVAQHSVWASRLVPPEHALRALLHDGAEYLMRDLPKWIKGMPQMEGYRLLLDAVQHVVYAAFGLDEVDPPELEAVDRLLVRYEMWRGFGDGFTVGRCSAENASKYPPLTDAEKARLAGWDFWTWERAEAEFLDRFAELQGDLTNTRRK